MRDLFDKYYEHPVDRIRELGQTSGFHRRDYFGEIKKDEFYQSNLQAANKGTESETVKEDSLPKRGSIKEVLLNLFYQQFSFLYLLVGTAWIVLMGLFFLEVEQSPYQDGRFSFPTDSRDINLNLHESQLEIVDYHLDSVSQQPYYLNYDCYSNTFDESNQQSYFSNCILTLFINQNYLFHHSPPLQKFTVNCAGEQKCLIQIKSNKIIAETIQFTGYNIHVRAESITAKEFIYDSYKGSIQVKHLNSLHSLVNTHRGDVVIQTSQNVILNTVTVDRLVCATAPLALKSVYSHTSEKDEYVKVTNLDRYFERTNGTSCSLTVPYTPNERNQFKKELNHQFRQQRSPFGQFRNESYSNNETSCNRLSNIILINKELFDEGPQDLLQKQNQDPFKEYKQEQQKKNQEWLIEGSEEIQELSIFNEEGNVFVNLISNEGKFAKPLNNSAYNNGTISFSNSTQAFISKHLQDTKVKDLAQLIMKIDFDDRKGIFQKDNQISVTFNFQYRFLPPWWISTLTFNTLNFQVFEHDLLLTPSQCPYYLSDYVQEKTEVINYDNIIYQKLNSIISAFEINDVSYRFNGKFMNEEETAQTIFLVSGVIILVLCAIGSIMMHMYFYRKVEIDRNFLKRKAFEMWIFITMNLFEKKQYNLQNQQGMQGSQNNQFGINQNEQSQFGMSQSQNQNTGQQHQQSQYMKNMINQQVTTKTYFDQMLGLVNRLLESSILVNYNETDVDVLHCDVGPILQQLLSQPIDLMMKHEISRYMPIAINYCILSTDIAMIQDIQKQFILISKYLTTNNSNHPTPDTVINFSQNIQLLINKFNPPFAQKNLNISNQMRSIIIQCQGQLKFCLLNQSIYYLKSYIEAYRGEYRWAKAQNQGDLLPLDVNLQDDMLDQLSQLYLKCKNTCPSIFEQITNNDQEKVSIYMETLQDTMKMYNVYTRITKQLTKIQSNLLVRGLCSNMRTVIYLFDQIITSSYSQNFIDLLQQFWQYLSIMQINEQSSPNQLQELNKQTNFQEEYYSKTLLNQNNSQFNQLNQFNQTNIIKSQLIENNNYQTEFGQQQNVNNGVEERNRLNPKQIQIVQKYDYYPTFTNMINVIQCSSKTNKSTIDCFCELIFAEITSNDTKVNQLEYCDDITFDKFREYYAVYCYSLNCNEEVLEPNQDLNQILQKYLYAVDGTYIRAFSSTGKYKVYRGLMEYLFYAVNMAPKKNHEILFERDFSKYLSQYRHYLIKHSYKMNKINAYTFFETIAQYIFILFLLNIPFILCMPIIFAQSAYSHAYFSIQTAGQIYFQREFNHFFTIFCSSGFPMTVFVITFTFIFICAIDTLVYFVKPRLDKNNFYISYFKVIFSEFSTQELSLHQKLFQKQNLPPKTPYLADDLRFSSHGLNMSQQQLFQNNMLHQQNQDQVNLQDVDGQKIPQNRYSNRTAAYYIKLTYQIMFQILLWSLVGFNTFFFFITLIILTISSFVYLEQGLLFAIFLLVLIAVLFLRSRNLRETHKNTKQHLKQSWERLLICEITQQYAVNLSLNSQLIENFLRDKNLDEKYYRRNRIIAFVKAGSFYDESSGAIYQYSHPEKISISQEQFRDAIQYLCERGVYLCLNQLKISTSDIVSELSQQAVIQFAVFMCCSLIVDYFNLCKNGVQLILNAILTIVIAIAIFNFLDKKKSYINAQTLDHSVNLISRVQCKVGITIFTQNIGCKLSLSLSQSLSFISIQIVILFFHSYNFNQQ